LSDGTCTRCGHEYLDHRLWGKAKGQCEHFDPGAPCGCSGYTVAVLPQGERLEFGKHRLPQDEAETAPAWPPIK
jgi:hypothetical protein